MKIYTKTGDQGKTSLLGGTRVPKYDLRIEAYGTVDEVNAYLGMLRDQRTLKDFRPLIKVIQSKLFTIGSLLAADTEKNKVDLPMLHESDVELLEKSMDQIDAELHPLRNFILPGGHITNSLAHAARAICRRAERRIVELSDSAEVNPLIIKYINRLSDWLFMLARIASKKTEAEELPWTP